MSQMPLLPVRPRKREPRVSRAEALKRRTHGSCGYCGRTLRQGEMTRDHVVPRARGGETKTSNLLCCCRECNQLKADLDLEAFRARFFGGAIFWFELCDMGVV